MNTNSNTSDRQRRSGSGCGRNGTSTGRPARRRSCKEKVSSVGDYIRSVMGQLKSGSPPTFTPDQSNLPGVPSSNPLPDQPFVCAQPANTNPDQLGGLVMINDALSGSNLAANNQQVIRRRISANPKLSSRCTASCSSRNSPSGQQVWLMIVERMREEIMKARDIHRADLIQSSRSRSKRRRPSFPSTTNDSSPGLEHTEAAANCTVCLPDQSQAMAVTVCGHFLCWACLCKWHHKDASSSLTASKKECPCCKKILAKSQVTFIGEKLEDESSEPSCSLAILATDQRDQLLQAAALPVLTSRLQRSINMYDSSCMQIGHDHDAVGMMGNAIHTTQFSWQTAQEQTLAEHGLLIGEITCSAGNGENHEQDVTGSQLKAEKREEKAAADLLPTSNDSYLQHHAAFNSLSMRNFIGPQVSSSSDHEPRCDNQAPTHDDYQSLSMVHSCSYQQPAAATTHNSAHEDQEPNSGIMREYVEKLLDIPTGDGTFTDSELRELRQLQEALKLQLAAQRPLNLQSSVWLSTLLASTAGSGHSHSEQHETINNNNNEGQHLGQQAFFLPTLNNANLLSMESTFSSSVASRSSSTNNQIMPTSAGPPDDALSDWKSVFDDAWDWSHAWDWSLDETIFPL